jgi:hypothetical protein
MIDREEDLNASAVVLRSLEFPKSEHYMGFVVLFLSLTFEDRLGARLASSRFLKSTSSCSKTSLGFADI